MYVWRAHYVEVIGTMLLFTLGLASSLKTRIYCLCMST